VCVCVVCAENNAPLLLLAAKAAHAQADIDMLDVYGRTALMYAVHYGHLDCAHVLLSAGANPDVAESTCGCTALHEAVYHGAPLMV
jgi:ankyrin repeat protein